ncbi:MAG TPA: glycosyltransferase [Acidimicrobiia bacterium]|nr:glycosyltransferase [Acidimicrobiia bacterium]
MSAAKWRPSRASSVQLLDVAAGRPQSIDSIDIDAVTHHGLLGVVATHEHRLAIPPAIRLLYVRSRTRQNVMKSQLRRLLVLLERASIPAVVLKGPDMALQYRDPRHRTFTDVDLLVPRNQLPATLDLLRADEAVREIPKQRPRTDKRDVLIVDPMTGIDFALDLHWDVFSYSQLRSAADEATNEAWARSDKVVDSLGPRWRLPESAHLAFLCAHAVLDHRFRLILFRDLVELSRHSPDWTGQFDFAKRNGLRSTSYLAWLIAARALGATVPEEFLHELAPPGLALIAAERLLARTDIVTFDGHRPHPLNLAMVLVHDHLQGRLALAARAPLAIPGWRRRVAGQEPTSNARRDEKPSVEILVTGTQRRGAEVFGEQMAHGLRGLGWHAKLLSLATNPGPAVASEALTRKAPHELGRFYPKLVWALRRRWREAPPDVVIALGGSTLRYLVASATFSARQRPALVYVSIGEPLYWAATRQQRIGYRLLLRAIDLVISVSRRTAGQLNNQLGVPDSRLRVAPTGVPPAMFDVTRNGQSTDFRVLFIGALSDEKDPLSALHAFARLARETPSRLRILGSGPLEDDLSQRLGEIGLTEIVELAGSVADVKPHLRWADVLLQTSRTEGLPAAVLEAAAAGVPAVAFDVGGVQETVLNGSTGVLLRPGDIEGAAEAMLFYARHPEERLRSGERARKLVEERFTLEAAVARYHQLLTELLAARK